ncbi:hypothetical protein EVAR_103356_1 [Eumeta japonica]|uniref:Uncharacterized protein n=1 Tax=Eumeta variegata TaxID=151549 RepID=A0A4C1Y5H2_EUMVA|nr:hypothetical protein EVAR_103356_1 [Eumeta japonica]
MGKVSQVRMRPGCTPSKFGCQEDRRKRACSSTERPYIVKKQRMEIIAECLNEPEQSCAQNSSIEDTPHTSSDFQTVGQNEPEIIFKQKVDKAVQAFVTHSFRSKAVQTRIKTVDQALSPLKPSTISSSTSPFKATTIKKSSPSISNVIKITRNILIEEEHSDSDISLYTPSVATCSRSPSVHSLQVKSSSDCSELIAEDIKLEVNELNTIKN